MKQDLLKKIGKWLAIAVIAITAATTIYHAFVVDGKVKITPAGVKTADSTLKKVDSLIKVTLKDTAK